MNPVDEFVYEFKKLFPNSVLMVTHEHKDIKDDVVFYHDAPINATVSDECALEHLSKKLEDAGVSHWLVKMDL